jgi:hypothetical protein
MTHESGENETFRVWAPNVYLFAFHLHKGAEEKNNPLWKHCDRILEKFTVEERLTNQLIFPKDASNNRILNLLPTDNPCLNFNSKVPYNGTGLEIEGFAYPLQIDDSYALWLNVGCSDKDKAADDVDIQLLKQFNPDNLLVIKDSDNFLGQTLLITAWLTIKNKQHERDERKFLRQLADKCLDALLPADSRPPFQRAGELFGSPIFEYELTSQVSTYCHVLVWLFRDEQADRDFDIYQQEIIGLLFDRNKIVQSFRNSRKCYNELVNKYSEIQTAKPHDSELENLEKTLEKLFSITLEYSPLLGKLKDYDNTIKINSYNYNERLQQIGGTIGNNRQAVAFLEIFSQKICPYFQAQIQGDLGYFQQGVDLVNQAIASIRGLIEIKQTRIAQERQETENNLQKEIQALGVGVATGAIVASSSGLMTQSWTLCLPLVNTSCYPHPFIVAIILSAIVALLSYCVMHRRLH